LKGIRNFKKTTPDEDEHATKKGVLKTARQCTKWKGLYQRTSDTTKIYK
jgi:hypothetical protein